MKGKALDLAPIFEGLCAESSAETLQSILGHIEPTAPNVVLQKARQIIVRHLNNKLAFHPHQGLKANN